MELFLYNPPSGKSAAFYISNTPSHTTYKVHRIVVWNVEERLGGLHLSITWGS